MKLAPQMFTGAPVGRILGHRNNTIPGWSICCWGRKEL